MLITYETRIKIESLLKEGYSLANIARRLNFSRSTITREIRRGTQDSPKNDLNYPTNLIKSMYRARDAQFRAENWRHHADNFIKEISQKHFTTTTLKNITRETSLFFMGNCMPIRVKMFVGCVYIKFNS